MSAIIVRVNPPQILMHWIEITIIWAYLRGFWQSEIQTSLLSYRDYPKDLKFRSKWDQVHKWFCIGPVAGQKWFCIGPVTGLWPNSQVILYWSSYSWSKLTSDFVLAQLQVFGPSSQVILYRSSYRSLDQVHKWFCIGPVTGCWTKFTSDFVLVQLQVFGPSS